MRQNPAREVSETGKFSRMVLFQENEPMNDQNNHDIIKQPITAVMCMQPCLRDRNTFALNRGPETLAGTVWGCSFWPFF